MPTTDEVREEIEEAVGGLEHPHTVDMSPVEQILTHLRHAANIAVEIGRSDWASKMERLMDQIQHSPRPRGPATVAHLRPVGPMVHIDQWVVDVMSAIRNFHEELVQANSEDPHNFPLERTAADWWEELGQRVSRP